MDILFSCSLMSLVCNDVPRKSSVFIAYIKFVFIFNHYFGFFENQVNFHYIGSPSAIVSVNLHQISKTLNGLDKSVRDCARDRFECVFMKCNRDSDVVSG